jgi:hypothetical protein
MEALTVPGILVSTFSKEQKRSYVDVIISVNDYRSPRSWKRCFKVSARGVILDLQREYTKMCTWSV